MDCEKFRIQYSTGAFKLPPCAFRVWMLLEHDSKLRQATYKQLAQVIGIGINTITAAMPQISLVYKEKQTVGYLPLFLVNTCLSNTATKVLAWMWITANEHSSNRLYLTDDDIAIATGMSERSASIVRQELNGRFVNTELLTKRHQYVIRKPSQHLLNALAIHASVTQFTLLNPETGQPVKEEYKAPLGYGVQLTNRILARFGLEPLQPLEEPGLRIVNGKDELFVWPNGGFSLRRAGSRSKAEKGKQQIAKGNVFELYQLLAKCAPAEASEAVRFLDGTKGLLKEPGIDVAALDKEVLGDVEPIQEKEEFYAVN
jgi:hypothetical protein